jgi:hypothetical protein
MLFREEGSGSAEPWRRISALESRFRPERELRAAAEASGRNGFGEGPSAAPYFGAGREPEYYRLMVRLEIDDRRRLHSREMMRKNRVRRVQEDPAAVRALKRLPRPRDMIPKRYRLPKV